MLALNVYLAMCYHKLDYYDVSQEVLAGYVQQNPDSAIAINLKACNYYKLYNGKAAEVSIKLLCMYIPQCTFMHTTHTHTQCTHLRRSLVPRPTPFFLFFGLKPKNRKKGGRPGNKATYDAHIDTHAHTHTHTPG